MKDSIWHPPLYSFLKFANSMREESDKSLGNKILDCGAGGKQPPLALFNEYGYDTYGIDISDKQIERANEYARENGIDLSIQKGDMRSIPFDDGFFDYVYEIYSMCHMTKRDINLVIKEMARVIKKGGYCFLGFISSDTWPMMGQEEEPGEFWLDDDNTDTGGELHSLYRDKELEEYLKPFEIVRKEKVIVYEKERIENMSRTEWEEMYGDKRFKDSYDERVDRGNYTHIFYLLRKP